MPITGELIRSATGRLLRTVTGILKRCGCCDECVEYWRADACAMPEDLPSHVLDCLRDAGASTIWIRVGTICTTMLGPGDAIEPGDTVVYDDRCYTVIDEQRHKTGVTGCVDDGEIPEGSVILEGPTIPCQPQCDTDFCRAGFLDYVVGETCGLFGEPRYFCRSALELCRTCFDPYRDPGEGCFTLDPAGEHAGTVPSEEEIYSIVLLQCSDDCCQCEAAAEVEGSAVADGCLYSETSFDPFTGAALDPSLKCCCGTPTANAAATWTLNSSTLSIFDSSGGGITLEVLGTPITGIVPGECVTVTIRQQSYTGGVPDGPPIDTSASACAAACGPSTDSPVGFITGSGDGWSEVSSVSCNAASDSRTWSSDVTEMSSSVSWSRTGPTIAAPCVGGC